MPNLKAIPRLLDKMGFFSKLGEEVQRLPMSKGSGEQLYSMLLKQGVKPDELKYTGTDKFLKSRGSVAQKDLEAYVNQNRLKLEPMEYSDRTKDVDIDYNGHAREAGGPKFADSYQTKGGTNYRELGTTLPDQPHIGAPSFYHEDHFPDENIIEHRRVKDYETPSGEHVMLADETQSDWAQEARGKGFIDLDQKKKVDLAHETARSKRLLYNGIRKADDEAQGYASDRTSSQVVMEAFQDWQNAEQQAAELRKAFTSRDGIDSGPFVDNTSKWTDLSIKRGLHEAAKEGKDIFAWPKGGDVADRYSMRKVIDKIKYWKTSDGNIGVMVRKSGDTSFQPARFIAEDKLDQYVGRDLSDKIRAGHGETIVDGTPTNPAVKHIAGEDFPVGGEGHVAYYDQIYPKRVEEVMRKNIEPVRTEDVDLVTGKMDTFSPDGIEDVSRRLEDAGYVVPRDVKSDGWKMERWIGGYPAERQNEIRDIIANHAHNPPNTTKLAQGIRLTPEMRDKILKSGFPLFAIAATLGISKEELEKAMHENQPQAYRDGGLVQAFERGGAVRKLLKVLMNVGMDAKNGSALTRKEIVSAIHATGAKVKSSRVHMSDSEPTLVMHLDRPLSPDEAHNVSALLRQEAIAQVDHTGKGDLYGPGADQWKPFNGEYFLKMNGKKLIEPANVAPPMASPDVPPKVDMEPIGPASGDLRSYVNKELDELD